MSNVSNYLHFGELAYAFIYYYYHSGNNNKSLLQYQK